MLGAACLAALRPGVLQQRQSVLDVLHTLGSRAASLSAAEAAMVAAASIVNKAPGGEMLNGLHITLRTAPLLDCIEDKRRAGGRGREGVASLWKAMQSVAAVQQLVPTPA